MPCLSSTFRSFLFAPLLPGLLVGAVFAQGDEIAMAPLSSDLGTFNGSIQTGIVLEVSNDSGANADLLTLGLDVGKTILKRTVFRDGSMRIDQITLDQLLTLNAAWDFSDTEIDTIEVLIGQKEDTRREPGLGPEATGRTLLAFKYQRTGPVDFEFRIYDQTFEWDIIGESLKRRALRAGFGLGLNVMVGKDDGEGDLWLGYGAVYGRISAIYAFSDRFNMASSIEVYPLLVDEPMPDVYAGTLARMETTAQYHFSKHLLAYLESQYEMAAVLAISTDRIEEIQSTFRATGGVNLAW